MSVVPPVAVVPLVPVVPTMPVVPPIAALVPAVPVGSPPDPEEPTLEPPAPLPVAVVELPVPHDGMGVLLITPSSPQPTTHKMAALPNASARIVVMG
jgi:hypothetical protein